MNNHPFNHLYRVYFKRMLDIILSLLAIIILFPIFIIVSLIVRIKLGRPIIFKQDRPGMIDQRTGRERIFTLCKFRSMSDKRDKNGKLLPDHERLTSFGKVLRSTSLDELPELFNILKGDMSIVGPRPQLVKDLVFMSEEIRKRHTVRPGLTGLAQSKGRNGLTWDKRFAYDLEYVNNVGFLYDLKIIFMTIMSVLKREGISEEGCDTSTDYGDWLLNERKISYDEYNKTINHI